MPRENTHDKGRRYLVEGRLLIKAVSDRHITAVCRGDSGELHVLAADRRGWACSCPAVRDCSHLVALRLCVLRPTLGWGPAEDESP